MKEDSKRLLRGMTEVSDQYILEAEAFYQKKDGENVDRENAVKEIKEKESIEKDKKIIKMQEAKKRKFITLPRILGFTASIVAACFVLTIGLFMFFAPKAGKPSSVMLEGVQDKKSAEMPEGALPESRLRDGA